eukprot:403330924
MTTQYEVTLEGDGLTSRLSYLVENHHSLIDKKIKNYLNKLIASYQNEVQDGQAKVTLNQVEFDKLINVLNQLVLASRNSSVITVELFRVLNPFMESIVDALLSTNDDSQKSKLDGVLSTILQYTNKFNFSILQYYVKHQSTYNPILLNIENGQILQGLEMAYRMFEAQPYLMKIWNISHMFDAQLDQQLSQQKYTSIQDKKNAEFLLATLRHMICPDTQTQADFNASKSLDTLDYLNSLTLNKAEEVEKQQYFDRLMGKLRIVKENVNQDVKEHDKKVMTTYLKENVDRIMQAMDEDIFQHFVITGQEGSGKMSFMELLSHQFHSYQSEHSTIENPYIVVTLEETFDSKNLVGTYVCNESGEFVFKKGPLTVAAENGLWLVLRNIEKIPSDLLTFLLPLVQKNELQVSSVFKIVPKLGFRIFALCQQKSSISQGAGNFGHEDIKPFLSHLIEINLEKIQSRSDFQEILMKKYESVYALSYMPQLLFNSVEYLNTRLNTQLKHQLLDHKQFSIRQTFKLFNRVNIFLEKHFKISELQTENFFLASDSKRQIIEEIVDIYLGYIYDKQIKAKLIEELVAQIWNAHSLLINQSQLDPSISVEYIINHTREFQVTTQSCYFGRTQAFQVQNKLQEMVDGEDQEMEEGQNQKVQRKFVFTAATLRTLEQILQAINFDESILLVGETGTGKTTQVQQIAKILNKKIHIFNMNQNTDSADLLGGFKPVDLKFLLKPIYEKFLYVFRSIFKSDKNQKFLDLAQKCYEENRVKDFLQCLNHGLQSISGSKLKSEYTQEITYLQQQLKEVQKRQAKLESGGGFIFQFIEGSLISSIKNGDWILLDEINLASESVLNRIATLVDGDYILLNERADIVETKRHPEFRIFMCMNPPYTSAGKKQLPWSLRSKLSEIYVPELDNQNDLWKIIDENSSNQLNESHKRKILEFYMRVREQIFKQTKRGNIGLRNLTRALAFMKSSIQLRYPVLKAVYDSLYICFASHLDQTLQQYIQQIILGLFQIKSLPELSIQAEQKMSDKYAYVEQFIIPKGQHKPEHFDENDFVTTNTFKKLLKQLASVVAVTDYAVILQGPTSAGKTSTVQYLANITNNKIIRINNHMHTDIQEYLGSYVPDKEGGGKLVFQEGVLVEAVRNGYWVILDELNLAPSEVLEALNRLLDDNRELFIVETQKVVKAHPNFRIFATQNPTEGYGGRKELSEAFKNRFILINVNEVPKDELQLILIHKCSMPQTRAKLMVEVMENLQIYRSQGNIFSGKESTITVRDLLKWANRLRQLQSVSTLDLALEGYLVLGERSRNSQDKQFIKQTIERVVKTKIDEKQFYEDYFNKNLKQLFNTIPNDLNLPKLIQSQQLKRLAVLMHKCLINLEPVLMVGETGCGKTTLCQVFASINKQTLYSINCHQNTETSDFIGCMRTRKNLKLIQDKFQTQMNELQILLKTQGIEIQTQYKDILRFKKDPQFKDLSKELQKKFNEIKELKEDLDCIFEWHDGILVESMQTGGLLLIDEISLANDSVLERLNSVFEADRTLVLSEKSSKEAVKIKGAEGFNMVATMNPSGDFGKKELSPALRNRMTEIWVESYFLQEELMTLYKSIKTEYFIHSGMSESIDLYLIIKETALDKLKSQIKNEKNIISIAVSVFNFIGFVNFTLASKHFALQRKALSIRDILNIIDFIKATLKLFNNDYAQAFRHSIELVIIDGLCLGIDVAGDKQKREIMNSCHQYLQVIESKVLGKKYIIEDLSYIDNKQFIGVGQFQLDKVHQNQQQKTSYAFDAETTKTNLLKLLRAYQLTKPILIEGPPGVGKTSLIENLAKVSGRKLIRVNLSEQTDMMDLLGSEYPVSKSQNKSDQQNNMMIDEQVHKEDNDDEDEIRFHWCDGVLLQALKEGHWFLIDEMNLAQQSVLEGLNALLDHRRTVYIPELNQEFVCHPDFFVFACQNPSQSTSNVSGRKTLPKSFLNRFNKIYLEELTQKDYEVIIKRQLELKDSQNDVDVELLLNLSHQVELLIKQDNNMYQEEGAINMRDLSRFMHLYRQFRYSENYSHDKSLYHAFQVCYLQRLGPKNYEVAIRLLEKSGLIQDKESLLKETSLLVRVNKDQQLCFESQVKSTNLMKNQAKVELISQQQLLDLIELKGAHSKQLQYLIDCLNTNLPILIQTNNPQKLLKNLETLSFVSGYALNRLLLNEKSDTSQLLGCFEQTSQNTLNKFIQDLNEQYGEMYKQELLDLGYSIQGKKQKEVITIVKHFIQSNPDIKANLEHNFTNLIKVIQKGTSRFEWVDSILIKAIEKGEWVVFENANLCNPSILDRLNPLLEEGNQFLTINEQGLIEGDQIRCVTAHQNFRSIFVVSHTTTVDQGKDVSRALKNRCLQIKVYYDEENTLSCTNHQNKIIDMQYSQMTDDLLPFNNFNDIKDIQSQDLQEVNKHEGLGKRYQRSEDDSQIKDLIQYNHQQLKKYMNDLEMDKNETTYNKSYLNFLASKMSDIELSIQKLHKEFQNNSQVQFVTAANGAQQDGWQSFLNFKISQLQLQISTLLETNKQTFLNKNSQLFIQSVLNLPYTNTQTYVILLKQLKSALKMKDLGLLNYINVYLMSQSTENVQSSANFITNEDHILQLILKHSSISETLNAKILQVQEQGANPFSSINIKNFRSIKEKIHEVNQMPMKLCIMDLSNKMNQTNRVQISQLVEHFDVILMDDDKQILKFDTQSDKFDLYMIQEKLHSPYMILIPADQSKILVSQSEALYYNLNFLKDFVKLQSQKPQYTLTPQLLKRHTQLPVLLHSFQQNSLESYFMRKLALNSLQTHYYPSLAADQQNMHQVKILESVLETENQVNLRDLPAYFVGNSLMQRTISKLLNINQNQIQETQRFRDVVTNDRRVSQDIKELLQNNESIGYQQYNQQKQALNIEGNIHANQALDDILDSLIVLENSNVNDLLETLFIIPLELFRLEKLKTLTEQNHYSHFNFLLYHLKCQIEANRQTSHILDQVSQYEQTIQKLKSVKPDHEASQLLKNLLYFNKDLLTQLSEIQNIFELLHNPENYQIVMNKVFVIQNMIYKGGYETYFLHFNHLISLLMLTILTFVEGVQIYISQRSINQQNLVLQQTLTKFTQPSHKTYELFYNLQIFQMRQFTKQTQNSAGQLFYEQALKSLIKFKRISHSSNNGSIGNTNAVEKELSTFILEHFVRREIGKKLKEEQAMDDAEALIYQLPFKMKVQNIMDNNKPIDERTKEDKEKMEKEALKEIETNFPSYFDEFQKSLFLGQFEKENQYIDPSSNKRQKQEVKVQSILNEMLSLDDAKTEAYRKSYIKLRVKMLMSYFQNAQISQHSMILSQQDMDYLIDAQNYLREDLSTHNSPSVMNVSDVKLSDSYNFYHDPLPQEVRLVYDPLMKLMLRIRAILKEYESPILNDALFICNLIITECRPKYTPVMKILTGLEMILNKLEEWEIYASKSHNSTTNEMTLFKQLIIRYRKVQILSWRNLLSWKKNKMIKEDFENFIRLAHTLERQVFDKMLYKKTVNKRLTEIEAKYEIEFKIFELLDLFIRESSLGQFQSRMKFLSILLDHFKAKQQAHKYPLLKAQYKNLSQQMQVRLNHMINILHFVHTYYSQFQAKLQSTIQRLDAEARDKVKTLVDVSKWTVQKFTQVKNNIDKTHRQLNKAVKQEEEILMQNIASLILTSSRKKYINDDSKLEGLSSEKSGLSEDQLLKQVVKINRNYIFTTDLQIIKQLQFIEKKYLEQKYPDSHSIEFTMLDIFERLKTVRDLNKKHIQRRAFIDLLKYLKDQGLQQNFQSKQMSHMLIDTQIMHSKNNDGTSNEYERYYYKAHELMMLLDSSSQVDEHSDLRNVDIIRIRGFSQSLLLKMLQINQSMSKVNNKVRALDKIHKESKDYLLKEVNLEEDNVQSSPVYVNAKANNEYVKLVKRFKVAYVNLVDKVKMVDILDTKGKTTDIQRVDFSLINKSLLTTRSLNHLLNIMNSLLSDLTLKYNQTTIHRMRMVLQEQLDIFTSLNSQLFVLINGNEKMEDNDSMVVQTTSSSVQDVISKKTKLLQKYVQLFFQDSIKLIEEMHAMQALQNDSQRKDSIVTDTTMSNEDQHTQSAVDNKNDNMDDRIDLTIKERQEFVDKIESLLMTHIPLITETSQKLFTFKGISEPSINLEDIKIQQDLQLAAQLLSKVMGVIEFIKENEMRIFIYLIYEGFCGQEEQDDDQNKQDQEEDDKYFEQDGCGMGDGNGGEQNVSNQIEHEEQLEGLKNYDSDEEKKEKQEKEEKKDDEGEEDNDFEMKEADFDGELEDVPDKEEQEEDKKDDEEDDADDALDKVDDLLDNQLWNQNMEDLEQEEDEKDEDKKDKEELDLGERKLDQENQLKDQDKEQKAGDRDKQDREEDDGKGDQDKDDKGDKQPDEDMEMIDEDKSEEGNEEMPDGEEEKEEIPLDREENIKEDVQDDNKDMDGQDEDMEDVKSETDNEEDKDKNDGDEEDKDQGI